MSPLKIGQLVIVIKSVMLPSVVGKIGEVTSNKQLHKVYDPFTFAYSEFVGYSVKFPSPVMHLQGIPVYQVVFARENLKPLSDPDADTSDSTESDWKVKPPIPVVRENPCVELLKDIT
jgi:hypothetical protein